MEKVYLYKIQDFEDDEKYSQFIRTSCECKKIIENAVETWYSPEDERIDADNVFECIELFLKEKNIEFEWFSFENTTIIF